MEHMGHNMLQARAVTIDHRWFCAVSKFRTRCNGWWHRDCCRQPWSRDPSHLPQVLQYTYANVQKKTRHKMSYNVIWGFPKIGYPQITHDFPWDFPLISPYEHLQIDTPAASMCCPMSRKMVSTAMLVLPAPVFPGISLGRQKLTMVEFLFPTRWWF